MLAIGSYLPKIAAFIFAGSINLFRKIPKRTRNGKHSLELLLEIRLPLFQDVWVLGSVALSHKPKIRTGVWIVMETNQSPIRIAIQF